MAVTLASHDRSPLIEPARALLHPLWIASLGLLVLNDHVLKGSGLLPGWLTGKLSDLAGLVVAPVLLAALLRARTRPAIVAVHAVVGLGFAGLELSSSLTAVADSIYRLAGFSWKSTRDLTDLLALAVLPLAYLLTLRAGAASAADAGRGRKVAVRLLATTGLLACTASTGGYFPQQPPCGGGDCDQDGALPPEDCNDYDPNLGPGYGCPAVDGEDICNDGADNDGDGAIDCDDFDCDLACEDIDGACFATGQLPVQLDLVGQLEGSTLVGTSVTDGSCLGADSPEVIFQGTVPPGILFLGVPPGHGIHLRGDCPDAYTELACNPGTEEGGDVLELAVNGNVTVVVEAIDPFQAGPFVVPIGFSPAGCGDGVRADPEQCDDGNHTSGDGCSLSCQAELDPVCAAMPVIQLGQTADAFAPDASKGFVGSCGGSFDSPELGYRYTAASTSVTVKADSSANVSLYAMTGCAADAVQLACTDAVAGAGQETITLTTVPGDELTFFVELAPGEPADATFTLDLTEP